MKTSLLSLRWPTLAVATLALGFGGTVRAANAPIPLSEIGVRATADYHGDALGITATPDGARLRCGFQKLEGRATPQGLWLQSTVPGAADRFHLTASAIGRPGLSTLNPQLSTALPTTGTISVEDSLVRFTRPGVTEEYSVSVDGLRQDFVVTEKPPLNLNLSPVDRDRMAYRPCEVELRLELEVTGARVEALRDGVQFVLEKCGRKIAYGRLKATDARGRQLCARMEIPPLNSQPSTLNLLVNDSDATYPIRIDPTFNDANWVSLNGLPGAFGDVSGAVSCVSTDSSGNVYVVGLFKAIGTIGANHIAKWDGSAWSALGAGMNGWVGALAVSGNTIYAGGYFTTAGGVPATNIAKWDGSAWSALGAGMNGSVSALAVSGTTVYAGGNFTTADGVPANSIAAWDGNAWSSLGAGMDGSVIALAVSGTTVYAGGDFTTADGAPASFIAAWDGNAWSALGAGMDGSVFALAVSGATLYAGGSFTNADGVPVNGIAAWDGSAWSALGTGMSGGNNGNFLGVHALAVSGSNLYAGGNFTMAGGVSANYIAKWDGAAWSALGAGIESDVWGYYDPVVIALAVSGTNLFTGGSFSRVGEAPAYCIAKWNGSSWSAFTNGLAPNSYFVSRVDALAVSGNTLYAVGAFAPADGVKATDIAAWDGTGWSAVGLARPQAVGQLAVSGTNLYAAGTFTNARGVTNTGVALWNGTDWSALGTGMSGGNNGSPLGVAALAVSGTNLFAGGNFTTAGGVPANYIAKWNGSTWSALGAGIESDMTGAAVPYVRALAVSGTNLFAGGYFTRAGGVPANYIARWDGSAWSPLGTGMDSDVLALAAIGTNLFAGGFFTSAGGLAASRIAKWNGSVWSALGAGMGPTNDFWYNPQVNALAVSGTNLYVGGNFTRAGGVPANCIAAWNGNAWSALGMGAGAWPNPGVNALAADGLGHLFVGGGFSVAGTNASPYIAQANIGPTPGRLRHLAYSPATGFDCTFSEATFGQPYRIEASPSLAADSWTDFTNFTYTGPVIFTDPSAAASPKKFYRAVSP